MPNIAIVTEGAHDVSFVGYLLRCKGFEKAQDLDHVPESWKALFPKTFPFHGSLLERVARYPEVYTREDIAIGIMNANGDNRLIPNFRDIIDAFGSGELQAIAIVADADAALSAARFSEIVGRLNALNTEATAGGEPNYPIDLPSDIGRLSGENPKLGIYVMPDNEGAGALETLLMLCVGKTHVDISTRAFAFVECLDQELPSGHPSMNRFRSGMGRQKAAMGIVGNILKPGSSLAVAIEQGRLLGPQIMEIEAVVRFDGFLDALLSR